jgi:glucose-1-phosphate cytidylyltransferase
MQVHRKNGMEPWRVTLIDTGEKTMTGGRLKRVMDHIEDEPFCFTYGDGVSNVDISELIGFHKTQKTLATLTAVQPPGRFGSFTLPEAVSKIAGFQEKPQGDGAWVNGGFFVLNPGVFDYIQDDTTVWERDPLENLARNRELTAYRHQGFWQPMDTLRDKVYLEELWNSGTPPWKIWK